MAKGFRVRYRAGDPSVPRETISFELPIRMGRNPLNHCPVDDKFVSDVHAQLEVVDGKLCVRDLRSKNGVYSAVGERLAVDTPVELVAPDHAFVLGKYVRVQVDVIEHGRDSIDERLSRGVGSILGNRAALQAGAGDSQHPVASLPALSEYGGASFATPPLEPSRANQAPPMASLPGLDPVQGYGRSAPAAAPLTPPRPASQGTQHFTMELETFALLGLRELASSLVPGAPIRTTGDVARLITKLHDAVEVFCRCFVPLREGYAQFVSQMDLRRPSSPQTLNRSKSALRVETAKDPASLAAALLDWRNQDYDVPQAVEGIFADLMVHQMAMIDSVMRGVQALLQELSPENIEQALNEERRGMPALLGRYRALWQAFEARYEELTNESRTFEVVFGADFAATYREHVAKQRSGS